MKIISLSIHILTAMFLFVMATMTACSSEEKPTVDPIDDSLAAEPTKLKLSAGESAIVEVLSDFAFDTNSAVAKKAINNAGKPTNYAYSPLNHEMALCLLANGLDEPQRGELVRILGQKNLDDLNSLNTKLYKYLCDKGNGVVVSLANSVWYDNAYSLKSSYTDNMGTMYGLECFKKNFASAQTVDEINSWAAEKTHNMIDKVVNDDALGHTDMLLFNAMYFFGRWDDKFDIDKTDKQKFKGVTKSEKVHTMHKESVMVHSAVNGWQMVSESFKTLAYECLFILPPSTGALQDFDHEVFNSLIDNRRGREVTLSLPRFEIESKLRTADIIAEMGLPLNNLCLTPMGFPASYSQDLRNMGQATKIQVDEEGARLAAVTDFLCYATGNTPKYEQVKIDFNRPFIFVVRHCDSGAILMMGRVCDI